MQVSFDNGATWEDATIQDPRLTQPLSQPLPGDDGDTKRCNAAAAGVEYFQGAQADLSSQLGTGIGLTALVAAILAIIAILIGATGVGLILTPLIMGLAVALVGITATAFDAAFDADVWQRLLCNLFCSMAADASFSESTFQAVLTQLRNDETGLALSFLEKTMMAVGPVGLTNAVRSDSSATGDCSGCGCTWCYEFDFTSIDGGFVVDGAFPYGQWVSGSGWEATASPSGVSCVVDRTVAAFTVNHVEVDIVAENIGNLAFLVDGTALLSAVNVSTSTQVWDGTASGTAIQLNPSATTAQGAAIKATRLLMSGTGNNPFGDDNCS